MQITREELGATFTCKVNSIALVEPLTVDIKPDVHGEYAHTVSEDTLQDIPICGVFAGINTATSPRKFLFDISRRV